MPDSDKTPHELDSNQKKLEQKYNELKSRTNLSAGEKLVLAYLGKSSCGKFPKEISGEISQELLGEAELLLRELKAGRIYNDNHGKYHILTFQQSSLFNFYQSLWQPENKDIASRLARTILEVSKFGLRNFKIKAENIKLAGVSLEQIAEAISQVSLSFSEHTAGRLTYDHTTGELVYLGLFHT